VSRYNILGRLVSFVRDLRRLARIANAHSIARRMFVTNAFDGLLAALGVVMGLYATHSVDARIYVYGVLGESIAMGVFSGMIATYFSERAERLRELHEIERAVLHELDNSIYGKTARYVPLYVALWSGAGATLLPLAGITPLTIALLLGLPARGLPVYMSVACILGELFLIGYYLGRISGENSLLNGLKLAGIGVAAAFTLFLLKMMLP